MILFVNKFKDNLRIQRTQAKMSQRLLAQKIGVSVNNIGHWEKGRTEPNIDTLLKICTIFDISIEELLL